jgi:hypothetical protein
VHTPRLICVGKDWEDRQQVGCDLRPPRRDTSITAPSKSNTRRRSPIPRSLPFVLYSLRHTFLTRLGASGCDVWTLMRIAGHSSIAMSMRYVHPHSDTIDRAVSALTGKPAKTLATAGGHKNGHNRKLGARRVDRKTTRKVCEYRGFMVSAAGLEPATHALKVLYPVRETTTLKKYE